MTLNQNIHPKITSSSSCKLLVCLKCNYIKTFLVFSFNSEAIHLFAVCTNHISKQEDERALICFRHCIASILFFMLYFYLLWKDPVVHTTQKKAAFGSLKSCGFRGPPICRAFVFFLLNEIKTTTVLLFIPVLSLLPSELVCAARRRYSYSNMMFWRSNLFHKFIVWHVPNIYWSRCLWRIFHNIRRTPFF